jgi:hypothetical protein
LLISSSDLPGNQWEEVGSRSYRDAPLKLGIDRVGTGFSTPFSGIASENVYQFQYETFAKNGYVDLADLWLRLESEGTEWDQLEFPSDVMISADEYSLDCSTSGLQKVRTCWFLSRYKTTVIEFRITMIIVSESDLYQIIETINNKVEICEDS